MFFLKFRFYSGYTKSPFCHSDNFCGMYKTIIIIAPVESSYILEKEIQVNVHRLIMSACGDRTPFSFLQLRVQTVHLKSLKGP